MQNDSAESSLIVSSASSPKWPRRLDETPIYEKNEPQTRARDVFFLPGIGPPDLKTRARAYFSSSKLKSKAFCGIACVFLALRGKREVAYVCRFRPLPGASERRPDTCKEAFQSSPRAPKMSPAGKCPQDKFLRPPRSPKVAQDGPEMAPRRPKRTKQARMSDAKYISFTSES